MKAYLLRFPLFIVALLATYPLAPIMALFASPQSGLVNNAERLDVEPRLPWWLDWAWGHPDNSLLGDDGHKARWAGKSRYMQMVAFIWRNPAYNLTWHVMGMVPLGKMRVSGNPWIKNRDNAVAGELSVEFDNCWLWKSIVQTGPDTCRMLEFGWRLQPWAQDRGYGMAQYVFSIRPSTAFNPTRTF